MLKKLEENLIDSFNSVMPIAFVVVIIAFLIGVSKEIILAFVVSSFLLVLGMSFFTLGADMSMITIGENMGKTLVKSGKKWLMLVVSFLIGIVITIAEPDLMVLAHQLPSIPSLLIILAVAFGVGLFLLIAVFRIFKNISFRKIVTITLLFILVLLFFTKGEFISIAFDAGGVTTGPMGVPLIVAFGYGLSMIRSDKNAKNDSFGLCGLSSLGPILIILLLGLFFKTDSVYDTSSFLEDSSYAVNFTTSFLDSLGEVFISLLPILVVFVVFQLFTRNLTKKDFLKILLGIFYTILGLTLFLTGVSAGFLKMGYLIGNIIALSSYKYLLIPLGMIFGYIIINAEPAIKILNIQISDLTEGSISYKMINFCLSIGVSLSIGLALLRVFFAIPIIYFLIPGYFLACFLTYKSPKVFTAIAFDSGGAASGPLTTSFLLPICIGACLALDGNILMDAFGVGALVSMTPLITVQLLGVIYQTKVSRSEVTSSFDEEIIDYVWEV